MKQELTGVILVDVVKALSVRKIMRTGPKATRKRRAKVFIKEFDKN